MKHILIFILLTSAIFATPKQIIVGSYTYEKNALNALTDLSLLIENDDALRYLIEKNSLKSEAKKIKEYYAVSVLPLSNYVQLLRTLKRLKEYYPDAYVVEIPKKLPSISEPELTKKSEEEVIVVNKVEVVETVAPVKPLMKRDETVVKKAKIKIEEKETEEPLSKNKDFLLILLALVIFALAIYMRKKAKKEE